MGSIYYLNKIDMQKTGIYINILHFIKVNNVIASNMAVIKRKKVVKKWSKSDQVN